MWRSVAILTAMASVPTLSVTLASHALILGPSGIPDPSQGYIDEAVSAYMAPLGFDGPAQAFVTPEQVGNQSYVDGLNMITNAVEQQWDSGQLSSADPLWLFGYSQSATILSSAEQAWASYGIPSDALHLVMVGDPASTQGGFIGNMADWILTLFGYPALADAVPTPDNLYDTDVFTIPGDGWADYENASWGGLNPLAIFNFQHDAYLGFDPSQIQDVIDGGPSVTDGMTDYFTVPSTNLLGELWDAWVNVFG